MKLSRVVVIVAVTAAIVYFGLNLMLPRGHKAEAPDSAAAATTDEVFAAEAPAEGSSAPAAETASAEAPAAASEAAPASEAPATTEVAASEPAAVEAPTETYEPAPSSAPPPPPPAPVASPNSAVRTMTDADARRIADNISRDGGGAVEVPPVATAAAPSSGAASGDSLLSDEQARRIAENVASEGSAGSAMAAAPTPPPAPKPAAAKPAPKPVAKAAPKPATEVAAAAPKAAAPKLAKPAAKTAAPSSNGSDVITSWWTKAGAASPDRLSLVYAGEASSEKAVVLMFNNAVDPAAAGANIKVVDSRGAPVSGAWASGRNPRVLAFKGVAPGRYTVIVGKALADSSGKTLGSELVGPVYVH